MKQLYKQDKNEQALIKKSDYYYCTNEIQKLLTMQALSDCDRALDIQFKVLNKQSLKDVIKNGCKVLCLDSEIEDPNGQGICIEDSHGSL